MFGIKKKDSNTQTEKGKYKFLISLVLAVAITVALISYEDYKLSKYDTVSVVCVNKDVDTVANGTVITEENVSHYFTVSDVQMDRNVKNSLSKLDSLIGMKTNVEMYAGSIVTSAEFSNVNEKLSAIVEPVETSINASDLSQLVGGILREGDTIDISIVGDDGDIVYELKDVYVTKAFNSSGVQINKNTISESESVNENAMIVNVIISKMDEMNLNKQISNGKVRVSKTNDVVK